MRLWGLTILGLIMFAFPTIGNSAAPDNSIRPSARAVPTLVNQIIEPTLSAPSKSARPQRRDSAVQIPNRQASQNVKKPNFFKRLKQKKQGKRVKKGATCGVNGIEGVEIKPVPGRIRGCGVSEPVRITAVDGVSLSSPSIMDCSTAKALHSWINGTVRPVVNRKGGGVKSIKVAAHYACRTRNNKKGARISEHGKGRAIDISAIHLNDGSSLTVLKDWRSRNSKIMRKIHQDACGPFGTVLGPNADRYHQDHFHFDTARYRSGPYCR
jgi:hypothetical protein